MSLTYERIEWEGLALKFGSLALHRPFDVPELGRGWTKTIRMRPAANGKQLAHKYYTSPKGKIFRSLK